MAELDDKTYKKIKELCAKGDALTEQGKSKYNEALDIYWSAFDEIPEPKADWEATTWVLIAIGDVFFLAGDYESGLSNFNNVMHCPGGIGNPFVHLRLGQCAFELGDKEKAADELTRTYSIEGEEIFSEDDPKYLTFLKTRLEQPKKKSWWKRT